MLKRIILSRDWWCTSAILALRGMLRQEDHYELVVSLDQNEFKAYTWVMQGKSVKKTENRKEGRREGEGDRNREKRKREREGVGKGREIDLSKA